MKQGFQADNPWDSDDYFEDDEEDQKYSQKIQEQLVASKPYEQTFDKFSKWYNDYFTQTVNFEDQKIRSKGRREQTVIQINNMSNVEGAALMDIVNTKYVAFNKITSVFTYLDMQVDDIKYLFENKLFGVIQVYGERPEDEEDQEIQDGQSENELAKVLNVIKQLYEAVKQLMAIAFNIVNQVNTLFNKKEAFFKAFKNVEFFSPLETLGKIMTMVYTLDQLIINNECLQADWNQYKKMIKIIRNEPDKFGCTPQQIKVIEKSLIKFEKTVMSKRCTEGFLSQTWDLPSVYTSNNKNHVNIAKNKDLIALFQLFFKIKIQNVSEVLTSQYEVSEKKEYFDILGVYSFYRRLFEEDKKIYKSLWNLQRKSPIVISYSQIVIYSYKFLCDICPLQKKATLDPKDPVGFVQEYIQYIDSTIVETVQGLYSNFCIWLGRMESITTSNQDFEDSMKTNQQQLNQILLQRIQMRTKLVMSGLLISNQVKNVITTCLITHLNEGIEIPPSILPSIRQGIEVLQAIKYVFSQQIEAFNPTLFSKILFRMQEQILAQKLDQARKADANSKKFENSEIIGSLELVIKILRFPCNSSHLAVLKFVQQICFQKNYFNPKETQDLKYVIQKYEIMNRLQYKIEEATDCSFLFQGRDIIPILMQQIMQNPSISKRLPFIISAIEDSKQNTLNAIHLKEPDTMFKWFKSYVIETFREEYLEKTCRAVEDFLRLNIHTMLISKIENKNPYKEQVTSINRLLNVEKVTIFGSVIDIRSEIQQKLNDSFYNINVLNMHDMETYEEMRTLADHQFQIKLMHVYIPSQTIDQGATKGQLDILQIIRSIPSFVKKYKYNLYSQNFIEVTNDSKIVTTVGINQISDSIKTHGPGILNTTINSVYSFILKKINIFSQFLYDEYISSPLRREQKWFKENNESLDGKYPFQKAEQFLKQIKRLGKFEDGSTYIDKFRILITEVGNAIGFARLIRSASLNYCSSSIEYLPSSIETELTFTEMAKSANFGDTTVQASAELDDVFKYLQNSFSSRSDYLKILVQIVQKKVNIPENKHLQLFYQLLPALTLNFVDSILMAKERLTKANPFEAYFCDDGLVMGISYFLKLLDQNESFGSLHWKAEIKSYFQKHKTDVESLAEQNKQNISAAKQRKAEEIDMARGLSMRKIDMQMTEFDMLFFAFNACQVLFRDDPN